MCLVGAALVLAANPLMKSSAVLQQLLDDASMNVLSDLSGANLWRRACSSGQGGQPLDDRGSGVTRAAGRGLGIILHLIGWRRVLHGQLWHT